MLKEINEKIVDAEKYNAGNDWQDGYKYGKEESYENCKAILERVIEEIEAMQWKSGDNAEECKNSILQLLKGET